ncbi:MAG: hypothetical protein FWE80_07140, partial [Oscillospiraceae bacterium]|nr:hypothetical protein [Oscillospiraceae bacterium]
NSLSMDTYPYVEDYPEESLYPSNFNDLGSGKPARLFNSHDPEVLDVHFKWMQENNIDGAALQRFYGYGKTYFDTSTSTGSGYFETIVEKGEKYGRSFYMMYDLSGRPGSSGTGPSLEVVENTKKDFIINVEGRGLCSSTMYAHAGGRPVVCLWGLSSTDPNFTNYFIGYELTRWFQERGYYVIIGTPENDFRNVTDEWFDIYTMCDMISPWNVGRYNDNNSSANFSRDFRDRCARDLVWCKTNDVNYQPTMLAGFAWANMRGYDNSAINQIKRNMGQFLWGQGRGAIEAGVENIYYAMFDEYDEGTSLMKAASDYFDVPGYTPANRFQYFQTYAADGWWLSQDFYMRVAGDINRALNLANTGKLDRDKVQAACPTPHAVGEVRYRNSFEGVWITGNAQGTSGNRTVLAKTDPGTYTRDRIDTWNGANPGISFSTEAEAPPPLPPKEGEEPQPQISATLGATRNPDIAITGEWVAAYKGTISNTAKPDSPMLVAPVRTAINDDLTVSYQIMAVSELGKNVFVDLVIEDAAGNRSLLSDAAGFSVSGTKVSSLNTWQKITYDLPASVSGKYIAGIVFNYKTPGSGSVEAYIDDLFITAPEPGPVEPEIDLEALTAAVAAGKNKQNEAKYKDYCNYSKDTLSTAIGNGETQLIFPTSQKEVNAATAAITAALVEKTGMRLKGDVDGDGEVKIGDVRVLLQNLVGKVTSLDTDPIAKSAAMVSNSGYSTYRIDDARIILQYLVEKITEWP